MALEREQSDTAVHHSHSEQAGTLVPAGLLRMVRVAWVITLGLMGGLFLFSLPFTFADAHTICVQTTCNHSGALTPDLVRQLRQFGLSLDFYATLVLTWSIILEIVYVAVGVIIFWRKSHDRMALVSSFALITFGAAFRGFNPEATLPSLLSLLAYVMAFVGNGSLGFFFYLFPDGRLARRWMGFLLLGWTIFWGVNNLVFATILTSTLPDFLLLLGLLGSVVITQIYRYRRISAPLERQQTKWVVFGVSLALLGVIILFGGEATVEMGIVPHLILGSLLYLFLLLIPLSIGFAILRYRLWDIDLILNRTLVYGGLSACIVGIYVFVVGYLGALLRTGSNLLISLIATGLVAVLFQPLRSLLQRGVNRLFYGQRDEPYAVMTRLNQRLEATLTPDTILSTVVETVTQTLKLPYAAIQFQDGEALTTAASYGSQPAQLLSFPLVYQSKTIGTLLLATRAPGEAFTPADMRLLNELTRQVSLAAHAVRLTADLQRSNAYLQAARERLVTTREEERRRLRRDLHDGLGPTLAALALAASVVSDLIPTNPQAAVTLANALQNDIRTTVGDIRRLVYDLRPPALDELGLIPAIRERIALLSNTQHQEIGPLHPARLLVQVDAPESLPPLPAAVEVAAYRIVQEALTNVIRHAQARTCLIHLALTDALEIEIIDDGIGLPEEVQPGVGRFSMRERAAELGGECMIEKNQGDGTRVCARLPLTKE